MMARRTPQSRRSRRICLVQDVRRRDEPQRCRRRCRARRVGRPATGRAGRNVVSDSMNSRPQAGPQRNFRRLPAAIKTNTLTSVFIAQPSHLASLNSQMCSSTSKEWSRSEPAARRRRRPARSVGPGRLPRYQTTGAIKAAPGCSVYLSSPRSSLPSCRRQTISRPGHPTSGADHDYDDEADDDNDPTTTTTTPRPTTTRPTTTYETTTTPATTTRTTTTTTSATTTTTTRARSTAVQPPTTTNAEFPGLQPPPSSRYLRTTGDRAGVVPCRSWR